MMISEKNAPRLLGAAFLFVLVASAFSMTLYDSVVGTGGIADVLTNAADNPGLMRLSIIVGLFTSVGIVVLALLAYVVLRNENRIVALVAAGWWLAEAVTLAVSKIGALALIPLSAEFVEAGAPVATHFTTLGDFLHSGLMEQGDNVHMLFYSLGGVLWFYLFYRSRLIPRVLSGSGVVLESLSLIGMLVVFSTGEVYMWFFLPIVALELAVGLWLVVRGAGAGFGSLTARKA